MSYSLALIFWVVLGLTLISIEFIITGIGLLFLGVGSLLTAILIYMFPLAATHQYISFGLLSLLCFLIAWSPLKKLNKKTTSANVDIIGNRVKVINNPLLPGKVGEVRWSGTNMNAILVAEEKDEVAVGEDIIVKEIQGNVLVCQKE